MKNSIMRDHMKEKVASKKRYDASPALPGSVSIELNNTCNQKCFFCSFHSEFALNPPKPKVMNIDNVKRILDELYRLGMGKKEVGFHMAGEPFIYSELTEAIGYAKQLGFSYTFVTTNGAFATPDKIKSVINAGLDSIRFSINAMDRESYKTIHGRDDFDTVMDNLRFLYEFKKDNSLDVVTSVTCVLTKKTYDMKSEFEKLIKQYVDDVVFIPVVFHRMDLESEMVKENQLVDESKLELKDDYVCNLLFDAMYINADMEVMPCCEAYDNNAVFYDLKKDFDLEKAWNSEEYIRHRRLFIENGDLSNTLCDKCFLRKKGVESMVIED